MYNKIFTKILDSSIWLEPTSTRIVWITLIAAMDQDGYAHFSAVENLALRAQVSLDEAKEAVKILTGLDPNSADPEHGGRRIERVPGGFLILNAEKHRDLVTRVVQREQTRKRVAKYRAKKKGNAPVTHDNGKVTPSDTEAHTEAVSKIKTKARFTRPSVEEVSQYCQQRGNSVDPETFIDFYEANGWVQGKGKPIKDWKACVRTWEKSDRGANNGQISNQSHQASRKNDAPSKVQAAIEKRDRINPPPLTGEFKRH